MELGVAFVLFSCKITPHKTHFRGCRIMGVHRGRIAGMRVRFPPAPIPHFITRCKRAGINKEQKVKKYRFTVIELLVVMWDFGSQPYEHIAYVVHNPYGKFPAHQMQTKDFAVMAEISRTGNEREGQNVLYADGRNSFEKRPDVGVKNDNVYTRKDTSNPDKDAGRRIGIEIECPDRKGEDETPTNIDDSMLVNDFVQKVR